MKPVISIYPTGGIFTAAGGTGSIAIICGPDDEWSVSGWPSWVAMLSPMSGKGPSVIKYSVAPNNIKHGHHVKSAPRTGSFTFNQPVMMELQGLDAITSPTLFVDPVNGNDKDPAGPWKTLTAAAMSSASGSTIRLLAGNIIADNAVIPSGVKVIGDGRDKVRLISAVNGSNRFYCAGDNVFAGFTSELALDPQETVLNLSVLNVGFAQKTQQDAIHSGISKSAHWYFENCTFKSGYDTFNVNGPMGMTLAEMPLVEMKNCNLAVAKSQLGNSDMGRAIRVINYNLKVYGGSIACNGFTGANEVDGPGCGVCISVLDPQSRVELWNTKITYTPGAHPVLYVQEVPAQYNLAEGDPNGSNVTYFGDTPPWLQDVVGGTVNVDSTPKSYKFLINQL